MQPYSRRLQSMSATKVLSSSIDSTSTSEPSIDLLVASSLCDKTQRQGLYNTRPTATKQYRPYWDQAFRAGPIKKVCPREVAISENVTFFRVSPSTGWGRPDFSTMGLKPLLWRVWLLKKASEGRRGGWAITTWIRHWFRACPCSIILLMVMRMKKSNASCYSVATIAVLQETENQWWKRVHTIRLGFKSRCALVGNHSAWVNSCGFCSACNLPMLQQ